VRVLRSPTIKRVACALLVIVCGVPGFARAEAIYFLDFKTTISILPQANFILSVGGPLGDKIELEQPTPGATADATSTVTPSIDGYSVEDFVTGTATSPPPSMSFALAGTNPAGTLTVTNTSLGPALFLFGVTTQGQMRLCTTCSHERASATATSIVSFKGTQQILSLQTPVR
jgi:hypothetical protein